MAPADGSRHQGSDESISVAELLKRMGAGESSDAKSSGESAPRRRHRRAGEGGGVSVAELTGSMPVLDPDGKPMGRAARRRAREAEEERLAAAQAGQTSAPAAETEDTSGADPAAAKPAAEKAAPTAEQQTADKDAQASADKPVAKPAPAKSVATKSAAKPVDIADTAEAGTKDAPAETAEKKRPPLVKRTPLRRKDADKSKGQDKQASAKTPMPPKLDASAAAGAGGVAAARGAEESTTPQAAKQQDGAPAAAVKVSEVPGAELFGMPSGQGSHVSPIPVTHPGQGQTPADTAVTPGADKTAGKAADKPSDAAADKPAGAAAGAPENAAGAAGEDTGSAPGKAAGLAAAGAGVAGAGAVAATRGTGDGRDSEAAEPTRTIAREHAESDVDKQVVDGAAGTAGADHDHRELDRVEDEGYEGEYEDDWDTEPKRGGVGQWIVLLFQLLGAMVAGAALFVAFQLLWKDLTFVALALAIVVIIGLVAIVRVLRRGNDWLSIALAVLVGAGVTFGPLLLRLLT